MKTLNVTITGTRDLLMHNGQTADPSNKYAKMMKEISGKRKKVDADYDRMSEIEFMAGLYLNQGKIFLPGTVLEATIINGAKKSKLGKQFAAAILVPGISSLTFAGPSTPADRWADAEKYAFKVGVRVGQAKVIRTRPVFHNWTCDFTLEFDDSLISLAEVKEALKVAGEQVGVGDWRPRFGTFEITNIR